MSTHISEPYELTEADLPEPYQFDLSSFKNDDDFEKAAFELLKEATFTVTPLVSAIPATPFQRNDAIRRGLIKRLSLLGKSMLSDVMSESGYQHAQLSRQIIETAANYFYLADDEDGTRHDAYVNHSLAEEKASMAIIARQIRERGDDPLPIEKRMRRSIERLASAAGVDFNAVPAKKKAGWPSAEKRLEALSPVGYMPYRTGSSALHAGWSVLLRQDIEEVEGGFSLDKQVWPSVQPLTAAGMMMAEAAIHYLEREGNAAEKAWFLDRLTDLAHRIQELDEAHERFMQSA